MKTVTILGSTGSVGRQVLATISQHPDAFKVVGLSAYTNEALLREQIEKFNPTHYYFPSGAVEVQSSLFDFLEDEKNVEMFDFARRTCGNPVGYRRFGGDGHCRTLGGCRNA